MLILFTSCARAEPDVDVQVSILMDDISIIRDENERLREENDTLRGENDMLRREIERAESSETFSSDSTVSPDPSPTSSPAPTPTSSPAPTPTPSPLPEPTPSNLANMDYFTLSPAAHENSWTSHNGDVLTWGTARQDNTGKIYANGGILSGRSTGLLDSPSIGDGHSITYLLNANYSTFTGYIALAWESRDTQRNYQIRFWNADNDIILYESPIISGGTLPIDFGIIDVSGITQFRIERLSPERGLSQIGIVDANFHY